MTEEDNELEQLKKKRLAEMQKNISLKQKKEQSSEQRSNFFRVSSTSANKKRNTKIQSLQRCSKISF